MNKPKTQYIVKKDSRYLMCRRETFTGSRIWEPVFSIYRYDAARLDSLQIAQAVAMRLGSPGENWEISRFDWMTGNEEAMAWMM